MIGYNTVSMFSGRKGSVLGAAVVLHLLVGYVFYSGLSQRLVRAWIPAPLSVAAIVKPTEAPKILPTPPEWTRPTLYVPPLVDPVIAREPDSDQTIVGQEVVDAKPPEGSSAILARARVQTRIQVDPKHPLKIGSDYYPDGSIRAGEQGKCLVQITVSVAGQVTQASIQSSTGFRRLDDACLNAVRGARMLPATEDGRPVEKTATIPIVWTLTGR
jgi:periplasmic protein TonB